MNRADLQQLANTRLAEARALLAAGHAPGAYYLAGYVIECALKACIAKGVQQHDFPDREKVNQSYSHNLVQLLKIAGLEATLDGAIRHSQALADSWAVVKDWNESKRSYYRRAGCDGSRYCRGRSGQWSPQMGYTALVAMELTPALIEAGEKLVRSLDAASTPVPAAFWLLSEDSGWRLNIASPKVSEAGSRQFYSTLNAQLRTLGDPELTITHITAVRPDDPTVSLLGTAIRTGPGLSKIRFTGNVVNGKLIPDALIYRLT